MNQIDVVIENESSILSPFSGKNHLISQDLADYLEERIDVRLLKEEITINLICDSIDAEEEIIYQKAIHNSYLEKYEAAKRENKKNRVISLSMLFIGSVILTIGLILGQHSRNSVLLEIYDIVAWVFIWEAVDLMFFRNGLLRVNSKKYKALANSTIIYSKTSENSAD